MANFYPEPPIVIPFGTDAVAPEQLSLTETADGIAVDCRLPHVIIERAAARPLRLNSGGLEFGEPPPLPQMPEVADQLAYLLTHFQLYCTVWDKHPRRFLDSYFAFIHRQVLECRPELTQTLAPFGDLYRFEQWAFSALRPLPRAHLGTAEDTAAMIRVDIAFWTGAEIVAIDLLGSETRGNSHARRREDLARIGVRLIEIHHEILAEARSSDFAALLPTIFHRFWETEPLPSGPFTAGPLPDPD
jgi:hypothetical protein